MNEDYVYAPTTFDADTEFEALDQDPQELSTQELGLRGEDAAAKSLVSRDWQILERRWRCRFGEADIIARDPEAPAETVVFIEVKTRRVASGLDETVMPEEAVDAEKRQRYRDIALCYLAKHEEYATPRFDVIGIGDKGTGEARLHHVMHAFETDLR